MICPTYDWIFQAPFRPMVDCGSLDLSAVQTVWWTALSEVHSNSICSETLRHRSCFVSSRSLPRCGPWFGPYTLYLLQIFKGHWMLNGKMWFIALSIRVNASHIIFQRGQTIMRLGWIVSICVRDHNVIYYAPRSTGFFRISDQISSLDQRIFDQAISGFCCLGWADCF